ncbi:MAG: acetyltransferase [Vicinamibacteria bacterium]|jgi:sugar O-acyltransferase (sialic acid O-acetyltransferase NeuD family)|nr:acetyltransferase [Vicinamibacteria bacterium]MBP9946307.1 acetyltransferase [Vicinamibacteria bacterium]
MLASLARESPVYIFGAGGHGRVLAEIARAAGIPLAGFLDEDPSHRGNVVNGLTVVGDWSTVNDLPVGSLFAIGVGSNRERRRVADELARLGRAVTRLIHPSAVVAAHTNVGEGTCVGPLAVIHVNASVGRNCIVNTAAVVDHQCQLGDFAHVSANVVLGGGVSVGEGSLVGIGACVLPGVVIGAWSQVGAGAVVTRDVPDGVVAYGVPARVMGQVP